MCCSHAHSPARSLDVEGVDTSVMRSPRRGRARRWRATATGLRRRASMTSSKWLSPRESGPALPCGGRSGPRSEPRRRRRGQRRSSRRTDGRGGGGGRLDHPSYIGRWKARGSGSGVGSEKGKGGSKAPRTAAAWPMRRAGRISRALSPGGFEGRARGIICASTCPRPQRPTIIRRMSPEEISAAQSPMPAGSANRVVRDHGADRGPAWSDFADPLDPMRRASVEMRRASVERFTPGGAAGWA